VSTGSEVIRSTLEALGVRHVFGVPGTQNLELFEALRRSSIRTVLATHELAASFMANGYARASGRVGVLVTIPGPGFTYALTGLAEARLDSAPLLYLVGEPARSPGRHFQLQAIDQAAVARPLVKRLWTVETAEELAQTVAAAYHHALEGEPGPVVVQVPTALLGAPARMLPARDPSLAPTIEHPDPARLRELLDLVRAARRPVLLLGQGALRSASGLRMLAERLAAPVLTTPSGRGIVAEDHPQLVGFDVMRDDLEATNALLGASDLVLAMGCKLGHNGTAGFELSIPADRLIHVDTARHVLNANYPARLAVQASAESVTEHLLDSMGTSGAPQVDWTAAEIDRWRRLIRTSRPTAVEPLIRGARDGTAAGFFDELGRVLPADAILVTDSGLHQVLARRHYRVRSPGGLLFPSDFQSMGFGLPAAIAAKLANPGRPVALVLGDGGFLMSGMELLTAAREGVSLLVFVFNDGQLNQIRLQQVASFGHAHAVELRNPEFATLAPSLGARYVRFGEHTEGELRSALRRPGPTLVEVCVDDSFAVRRLRSTRVVRASVRRLLGPQLGRWLKRLVRS
jgi:acetolactate synthase-1/2/3 large subunit